MSTLLSSSVQGISHITHRINQMNTYNFRLCIVKSVGTVVGTIGTISLLSATFSDGVIATMAAIAVGSVGTLTGVGVNLAADFVNKKLTVEALQDVELLKGEGHGRGGHESSTTHLLNQLNPTRVLTLMGLEDNMTVLSHSLKLLQVHALLVRMFQMNTKLLIKVAYYKTKDQNFLNAMIRKWATSDGFSQGLKWVAILATGLVVLIDVALVIGEWQELGQRSVQPSLTPTTPAAETVIGEGDMGKGDENRETK